MGRVYFFSTYAILFQNNFYLNVVKPTDVSLCIFLSGHSNVSQKRLLNQKEVPLKVSKLFKI